MDKAKLIQTSFSQNDMESFTPTVKVGILATVNPQGLPHVTLISTLQAGGPQELIWGEFSEGLSKQFVRENPKTGFLIMTLDRDLWRGKATWKHAATSGNEFDTYNNTPMFRYNAYFGVHTAHYMDPIEHYGKEPLPMAQIVTAALKTLLARKISPDHSHRTVMNPWTRGLLDRIGIPKFLTYIGPDGYPVIIPLLQAMSADDEHIIFSSSAYGRELADISEGTTVAVFGLTFDMEDVLLRGIFHGIRAVGGVRCGVVQVNWIYNSMPPKPQQIYPEMELEAVTSF